MPCRNVPCGPVNTIGQIFEDPFIEARGVVHRFRRGDGVEVPSVAFPGKFSLTPAQFERPPPHVGEHTGEVLGQWLGLDEEQRERLRRQRGATGPGVKDPWGALQGRAAGCRCAPWAFRPFCRFLQPLLTLR